MQALGVPTRSANSLKSQKFLSWPSWCGLNRHFSASIAVTRDGKFRISN